MRLTPNFAVLDYSNVEVRHRLVLVHDYLVPTIIIR